MNRPAGVGAAGAAGTPRRAPSLACSLVLCPDGTQIAPISRTAGLGALAVCLAVEKLYGLTPQVKWPNDVLLDGHKFCGVLAEAHWLGDRLEALVLGIGINVFAEAVPPQAQLAFPATSLAEHTDQPIERLELLAAELQHLTEWWPRLGQPELISAWQDTACLPRQAGATYRQKAGQRWYRANWPGLDQNGALRLRGNQTGAGHQRAGR